MAVSREEGVEHLGAIIGESILSSWVNGNLSRTDLQLLDGWRGLTSNTSLQTKRNT